MNEAIKYIDLYSKKLLKILNKLGKRNPKQLEIIENKIDEILKEPTKYKNLTGHLTGFKRVHIDKSFVLIFKIEEVTKTVKFEDFDHHDKIYRKRF